MRELSKHLPTLKKGGSTYKGVELFMHGFDAPLVRSFLKILSSDPSLATLWGVHYFLFGVSLVKLGTHKHRERYLEKTNAMEIIGCCMMTEIGHGSNVLGLETTATYDHDKRGFIIHSPTRTSRKCWIGGGAINATHGVLFAKLILGGEDRGVHPFIVPLRNKSGQDLPGITTHDLRHKNGLNGVDNGIIEFDHLFVDYDALLDHYCEIDSSGRYVGKNGNRDSLSIVYKLMVNFIFARKYITVASEVGMAMVSTVFYLYPPQSLSPSSVSYFLTDFLSDAYALRFASEMISGDNGFNHWNASLMKAVSSEMNQKALQLAMHLYGQNDATSDIQTVLRSYYDDQSATLTYEGENSLLFQLYMKHALNDAKKWVKGIKSGSLSSWTKLLKWAISRQDPKQILLAQSFALAKKIGSALAPLETQSEQMSRFNRHEQVVGVLLGRTYGAYKICCAFERGVSKESKELRLLYELFAWKNVHELAPEFCAYTPPGAGAAAKLYSLIGTKKPNLEAKRAELEPFLPDLVAAFGFKLDETIDRLIPPPESSRPFDTKPLQSYL